MIVEEGNYLKHYGILRRSGRYPWGSGGNVEARSRTFLDYIKELLGFGLSEAEIAKGLSSDEHPFTTTDLRAAKTIARNAVKQADIDMATRLKDKGWGNVAIGERMGMPESSVRALLKPGERDKIDNMAAISNMLKDQVDSKGLIDIGSGVEAQLGISKQKLDVAVAMLKEQGYVSHTNIKIEQLGTGEHTNVKVLAPEGTSWGDVMKRRNEIRQIQEYSEDGGRTFLGIEPPTSIDSKRVDVRYAEQGGTDADGVIYVRPGVDDVSLGASRYAQVRIAVDGSHYLKGMAVYKNDLPDGVDLQFNTNKSDTGNKLDAMKSLKNDPDNPFGSVIDRQHGVMNVIREEGSWEAWSKTLSTQMLSKQSPQLAKSQLDITYANSKAELDEITALTNPTVRKKLLESYADGADSSSVHMKAASLPGTAQHVILPMNTLRETEIYAPRYKNGDRVTLIRHPHGGIFEIPELTVNNNHPQGKKTLGDITDAVGINAKVAERLSGADFDGDTVLVIPNNSGRIRSKPALEGLKNFDPKREYAPYDGMKTMDGGRYNAKTKEVEFPPGKKGSSRGTQVEMGKISNLITDMTIGGANDAEIARAVRHSMVVIDAEKHHLNYRQSAETNGILALKQKYQSDGGSGMGAATIISRAKSEQRVGERKPRSAANGGPIAKATGKRVYEYTGATYTTKSGKVQPKTTKSKKLAETDDAHTLSSGTPIEKIYADHSNRMKALANQARKEAVNTKPTPYSPSAKRAYQKEVASLNAKLDTAIRNRPVERQAQVIAKTVYDSKVQANPNMDAAEKKKVRYQALQAARNRVDAKRTEIDINWDEWNAIQAGAISTHRLSQILDRANLDEVKKKATPRQNVLMNTQKRQRAQTMIAGGYTQAEVANALGVSLTTLKTSLSS